MTSSCFRSSRACVPASSFTCTTSSCPGKYPPYWIESLGRSWAAQYLLQAFLAFNPDWEVPFASHAVTRAAPKRLQLTIPSFRPDALEPGEESAFTPGAFWLRRRTGSPVGS